MFSCNVTKTKSAILIQLCSYTPKEIEFKGCCSLLWI